MSTLSCHTWLLQTMQPLETLNAAEASARLTHFDQKAKEEAGMEISIPKTKVQHIQRQPKVRQTTEADIANLPPEKAFKHICDKCEMSYPNSSRTLAVHKGCWCKKRKTARKPSRKGTVAELEKNCRPEKMSDLPPKSCGSDLPPQAAAVDDAELSVQLAMRGASVRRTSLRAASSRRFRLPFAATTPHDDGRKSLSL